MPMGGGGGMPCTPCAIATECSLSLHRWGCYKNITDSATRASKVSSTFLICVFQVW